MPRSSEHATRRQQELARMLATGQRIAVDKMARRFGVNQMTIRRDLKVMEKSGLALRCYGGAIAAQRITFEFAFDERRRKNLSSKERIGVAAAAQVESGQTIFLDTGTTTLEVARALARRDIVVSVVTSSLVVASELWGRGRIELVLLGGKVRQGSPDLVGAGTEAMVEKFTADVAFVGSDGIDPERGCFAGDIDVSRVTERMIACARRAIVVADHAKLGAAGAVKYAAIGDLDELITDRGADAVVLAALRRKGLTVTAV
jgi:DeoR family fructose operon transcriptional repressor